MSTKEFIELLNKLDPKGNMQVKIDVGYNDFEYARASVDKPLGEDKKIILIEGGDDILA